MLAVNRTAVGQQCQYQQMLWTATTKDHLSTTFIVHQSWAFRQMQAIRQGSARNPSEEVCWRGFSIHPPVWEGLVSVRFHKTTGLWVPFYKMGAQNSREQMADKIIPLWMEARGVGIDPHSPSLLGCRMPEFWHHTGQRSRLYSDLDTWAGCGPKSTSFWVWTAAAEHS